MIRFTTKLLKRVNTFVEWLVFRPKAKYLYILIKCSFKDGEPCLAFFELNNNV
jgi:hypothetical protein